MSQSRENLQMEGRTDSAYFIGPFRPSTNYDKNFSQFSVDDLKFYLFTDGSFNSLPYGKEGTKSYNEIINIVKGKIIFKVIQGICYSTCCLIAYLNNLQGIS